MRISEYTSEQLSNHIWTPDMCLSRGMIGVYVVIDGNNSSGKSETFDHLRNHYSDRLNNLLHPGEVLKFLPEPVKTRSPEIENWYKGLGPTGDRMKKSDVGFEHMALQWRMEQQESELLANSGIFIGERHPSAGMGYYLKALHSLGKVSNAEYHEYLSGAYNLLVRMAWPQFFVGIHTKPKSCKNRADIDPDRKDFEKAFMTVDYLSALHREILEYWTKRIEEFCGLACVDEPELLIHNATPSSRVDTRLRDRLADDLITRIEHLVLDQRRVIACSNGGPNSSVNGVINISGVKS